MRIVIVALAVLVAATAYAALTTEVLVQTTATLIPRTSRTRSLEILNLGPNDLWCTVDGTPVANKSRKIATGASWSLDLTSDIPVRCLASTANQTTGAATIVTEVP